MIKLKEKREINKEFREKDDSDLWPICGRFSVAERAIRKARDFVRLSGGDFESALEYRYFLEGQASAIVNEASNH